MADSSIYEQLTQTFTTFKDTRGGATFDYITGEQCTTRLNEVLGPWGWSFRVLEHGIHAEADECWAHGELTATFEVNGERVAVTRQQFGSQKVKRSRSSGTPLDIGFDLKGAATDALKKCATGIGVALYLSEKYNPAEAQQSNQQPGPTPISRGGQALAASMDADQAFVCEECSEPLTDTQFKDGTNWPPSQLAVFGRRKHSRVLCMTHYREANQAKRRAEEALQQVPF